MNELSFSRRQALGALSAGVATVALSRLRPALSRQAAPPAKPTSPRCSIRSARTCSPCRRKARPASASTPARAPSFARSCRDRSQAGQDTDRRDASRRPGPRRSGRHRRRSPIRPAPASRWSKSAYRVALDGFALPYGDVAVGGWRNTPYVVIQNVGAYLDVPRFLDTDHPVENAADAEAYLARLESYPVQLDGELGRLKARGRQGPDRPRLPDRQGGQPDDDERQERSRGRRPGRIDRTAHQGHSRRLGRRARAPSPSRRSLRRSNGSWPSSRRSAPRATMDAGMWARPRGPEFYHWALRASTTTADDARRDPPDGPRPGRRAARPDGRRS